MMEQFVKYRWFLAQGSNLITERNFSLLKFPFETVSFSIVADLLRIQYWEIFQGHVAGKEQLTLV